MKRHKLRTFQKRKEMPTTLLIDCKYLAYRGRYSSGTSGLSHDDIKTNVYFTFFSSLLSVAKKFQPQKVYLVFDVDSKESARSKFFPEYKVKRYKKELTDAEKKANKLFKQEYLNIVNDCQTIGMQPNFLIEYESDDLIALYCQKYSDNEKIIIISRDQDFFQCIEDTVSVWNPDDKLIQNKTWFLKTYGIDPLDWNMVKAIAGCSSDGVPGIERVGEKTALKYLTGQASEKETKRINDGKSIVERNLQLVTLPHPDLQKKDFYFNFTPTDLDTSKFISMCQKYGFRSFLENLSDWAYFSKTGD
jgi:DNA polymerase-1